MVSGILDNLGTAIGKSNSVRSRHNTISIRSFTSVESSLGVVIGHSIFISVWFRSSLFFDIWGRGMVSWSCMHNRGMVSGSSNNRGMVSWSCMDDRGMVSWSSMEDRGRGISCLDWECSWSNGSSRSLLVASIAMYGLRSSMGLAHNRSMYSSMGFVDRVANSRSITLLNALVMSLIGGNYGQKGGTDKSPH